MSSSNVLVLFDELPDELYKVIFSFANEVRDIEAVLNVSKKWRELALTVDAYDWKQFEDLADKWAKSAEGHWSGSYVSRLASPLSSDVAAFHLAFMSLQYYKIAGNNKKKFDWAKRVYDQPSFLGSAPENLRYLVIEILAEKKSKEKLLFQRIGALVLFVAILWAFYKIITDL